VAEAALGSEEAERRCRTAVARWWWRCHGCLGSGATIAGLSRLVGWSQAKARWEGVGRSGRAGC
jgi:hypothetical protein